MQIEYSIGGKNVVLKRDSLIRITHQCQPSGLIPDKYAKLLYEYGHEGKWYATKVDYEEVKEIISELPKVDSHNIYLLEPEIKIKNEED